MSSLNAPSPSQQPLFIHEYISTCVLKAAAHPFLCLLHTCPAVTPACSLFFLILLFPLSTDTPKTFHSFLLQSPLCPTYFTLPVLLVLSPTCEACTLITLIISQPHPLWPAVAQFPWRQLLLSWVKRLPDATLPVYSGLCARAHSLFRPSAEFLILSLNNRSCRLV